MICKKCGEWFPPLEAMFYCGTCRKPMLNRSRRVIPLQPTQRDPSDWQIYDENHVLVWAHDLAKRYRNDLDRRMEKDFLNKKNSK